MKTRRHRRTTAKISRLAQRGDSVLESAIEKALADLPSIADEVELRRALERQDVPGAIAASWDDQRARAIFRYLLEPRLEELIRAAAEAEWSTLRQRLEKADVPGPVAPVAPVAGADAVEGGALVSQPDRWAPWTQLWAVAQLDSMIQGLVQSTREALRKIVARSLRESYGGDQVRLIESMIGLNLPQATALFSFSKGNPSKAAVADYQARLRHQRAVVIARTETNRVAHVGQEAAWDRAGQHGWIDPATTWQKWVITIDKRTDKDICAPMEGQTVPLHGMFVTGKGHSVSMPPAHPQCRCTRILQFSAPLTPVTSLADLIQKAEGFWVKEARDPHTGKWIKGGGIAQLHWDALVKAGQDQALVKAFQAHFPAYAGNDEASRNWLQFRIQFVHEHGWAAASAQYPGSDPIPWLKAALEKLPPPPSAPPAPSVDKIPKWADLPELAKASLVHDFRAAHASTKEWDDAKVGSYLGQVLDATGGTDWGKAKQFSIGAPWLQDALSKHAAFLPSNLNHIPGLPPFPKVAGDKTDEYLARDLKAEGIWFSKDVPPPSYGGVVMDDSGKILLRAPAGGHQGYAWTFPKGGIDPTEHEAQTAIREVAEETGTLAGIVGHIPQTFGSGGGISTNYYLMRASAEPLHPELHNGEKESVKWVSFDEAKNLISLTTNEIGRKRDLAVLNAAKMAWADLQGPAAPAPSSLGASVSALPTSTVVDVPSVKKVKGAWPSWSELSVSQQQAMATQVQAAYGGNTTALNSKLAGQEGSSWADLAKMIYGDVTAPATASGHGGYQFSQSEHGVKATKAVHDVITGKGAAPFAEGGLVAPPTPHPAPSVDLPGTSGATVASLAPSAPSTSGKTPFGAWKEHYALAHPGATQGWSAAKWKSTYAVQSSNFKKGKLKDPTSKAYFESLVAPTATTGPTTAVPSAKDAPVLYDTTKKTWEALSSAQQAQLVQIYEKEFSLSGQAATMAKMLSLDSSVASNAAWKEWLATALPKLAPAAPSATTPSAPSVPSPHVGAPDNYIPSTMSAFDHMAKVAGPAGAQPGQWYTDAGGNSFYVKPSHSAAAAHNEVGGMKVYQAAGLVPGVDIPHVETLKDAYGNHFIVSQKIPDLHGATEPEWKSNPSAQILAWMKFLGVNALSSHYDAVGANPNAGFDNMLLTSDGQPVLIEAGGSMARTGLLGHKETWKLASKDQAAHAFFQEVQAVRGLSSSHHNKSLSAVFGGMSDAQVSHALGELEVTFSKDELTKLWNEQGMPAEQQKLNLSIIQQRLDAIPQVQEMLGHDFSKAPSAPSAPSVPAEGGMLGLSGIEVQWLTTDAFKINSMLPAGSTWENLIDAVHSESTTGSKMDKHTIGVLLDHKNIGTDLPMAADTTNPAPAKIEIPVPKYKDLTPAQVSKLEILHAAHYGKSASASLMVKWGHDHFDDSTPEAKEFTQHAWAEVAALPAEQIVAAPAHPVLADSSKPPLWSNLSMDTVKPLVDAYAGQEGVETLEAAQKLKTVVNLAHGLGWAKAAESQTSPWVPAVAQFAYDHIKPVTSGVALPSNTWLPPIKKGKYGFPAWSELDHDYQSAMAANYKASGHADQSDPAWSAKEIYTQITFAPPVTSGYSGYQLSQKKYGVAATKAIHDVITGKAASAPTSTEWAFVAPAPTTTQLGPALWDALTADQKAGLTKLYEQKAGAGFGIYVKSLVSADIPVAPGAPDWNWIQGALKEVGYLPSGAALSAPSPSTTKAIAPSTTLWQSLTNAQKNDLTHKHTTDFPGVPDHTHAPTVLGLFGGTIPVTPGSPIENWMKLTLAKVGYGAPLQTKTKPVQTSAPAKVGLGIPTWAQMPGQADKLRSWDALAYSNKIAIKKLAAGSANKIKGQKMYATLLGQQFSNKPLDDPQFVQGMRDYWGTDPTNKLLAALGIIDDSHSAGATASSKKFGEVAWKDVPLDQQQKLIDATADKYGVGTATAEDDLINQFKYGKPTSEMGKWIQSKLDEFSAPAGGGAPMFQGVATAGPPPKAATGKVPDWIGKGKRPPGLPAAVASIDEIHAALSSGEVHGAHGWSTAFDAGAIEDLHVRVVRVKSDTGESGYMLKLKVTPPAAQSIQSSGLWQQGSLHDWKFKPSPDGSHLVEQVGSGLSDVGAIGKTLSRKTSWGEVRVHTSSSAANNLVQAFVKEDQLSESTMKELAQLLSASPNYPSPDEMRAMAEARLLHVFAPSALGRVEALAKIEKNWGVRPEDVSVGHDASGQLEFLLPDATVQAIMQKYDVTAFSHQVMGGNLMDILRHPSQSLMSTVERHTEGVSSKGMSSSTDMKTGGADYVFTRQGTYDSLAAHGGSTGTFMIDASRVLRRMDWHAYGNDSYGTTTESQYSNRKISTLSSKGGSQETMFKHRVSLDDVEYVVVHDPVKTIKDLQAEGWTTWTDGRPLEQVIVKAGTPMTARGGVKTLTKLPVPLKPYPVSGSTPDGKGPLVIKISVPVGYAPQKQSGWTGSWEQGATGAQGTIWKWAPIIKSPGLLKTNSAEMADVSSASSVSEYKLKTYTSGPGVVPEPFMPQFGVWKPIGAKTNIKPPQQFKWGYYLI